MTQIDTTPTTGDWVRLIDGTPATLEPLHVRMVNIPSARERQLETENERLQFLLDSEREKSNRLIDLLSKSLDIDFEDIVAAINGPSVEDF